MGEILDSEYFEKFRKLIYDASGIHFSENNRTILESRLRERLRSSGLDKISDYYQKIQNNQEEIKSLLDSVTTNLTRFFRNTAHFQTFENFVIPKLLERKKETRSSEFKLWSAGCSTGEEPYSLAMVLKEQLPANFDLQIVASDISLKSLMVGQEGYYAENRINGIPEHYLNKYFDRKGNGYQIKDEIKNLVKFDYHNLKNDSGLRDLDVVFCRNVLIYFDETAQKSSVDRFWQTMSDYSYLFIGHSESLFGMKTNFEFVKTDWACVYRKMVKR
ncbi:MAG: protein-glutamate O-methyltransferase CheR [Spirochaetales bacterium]|nr:protein-glutamate O-methyltransferase CheR [Spirochaetales bacterium]MCF7939266.1 protein-glutamate O-methyltransferase CheR [Spirochaetales bacterium]